MKVVTLEPGEIRTNWARRARQERPDLLPEYEASVGRVYELVSQIDGQEESAPKKIAQGPLKLVQSETAPLRVVLSVDAADRLETWQEARAKEAAEWRWLRESTVTDQPVVAPDLKLA